MTDILDRTIRKSLISDLIHALNVARAKDLIEDFYIEKEGMGEMVYITMSDRTKDIVIKGKFADHLYEKYKLVIGYISYPIQKYNKDFSLFIKP
jgi:hypothetical protein